MLCCMWPADTYLPWPASCIHFQRHRWLAQQLRRLCSQRDMRRALCCWLERARLQGKLRIKEHMGRSDRHMHAW
jgi:hypothetical protein